MLSFTRVATLTVSLLGNRTQIKTSVIVTFPPMSLDEALRLFSTANQQELAYETRSSPSYLGVTRDESSFLIPQGGLALTLLGKRKAPQHLVPD